MTRTMRVLLALSVATLVASCAREPLRRTLHGQPAAEDAARVDCATPTLTIATVQGTGPRSEFAGREVAVEGVVTQAFVGLGGFFVESPVAQRDADGRSSKGLFVLPPEGVAAPVAGTLVRIEGTIKETGRAPHTNTELHAARIDPGCGEDAGLPSAVSLAGPLDAAQRESLEGMRVVLLGPLTLTGTWQMQDKALIQAAAGDRLFHETELARPGTPEQRALAAANRDREILLDGSASESFAPYGFLPQAPDNGSPWRTGTQVSDVEGVLDQREGKYRVQLTAPLTQAMQSPRPSPPSVDGDLRIASFNVFNFFDGDGHGGGFPTARGATDIDEMTRQRDKIARAIVAIGPDVAALMEVENDTHGRGGALATLVAAINARAGHGDYAWIVPANDKLGGDLIKVALIYRTSRVTPQGAAAFTTAGAFAGMNRVPLAQRFVARGGGKPFVVVANHFKSKGGCAADAAPGDRDSGDGQSCWNATRVAAAQALLAWLAHDAVAAGNADVLIVGDLNAYGQEDPVQTLRDAGYVDVVARSLGGSAYSFVYDGRSGRLDHALANAGMAARVTGAAEWHVNADELPLFDFNREGKSPAQWALGADSLYRASDHDPLVVGLRR